MDHSQSQIGSQDFATYENIAADQAFKMFLRDYDEVCHAKELSSKSLQGIIAQKNESFINPYDESPEERIVRRFCNGYVTVAKNIMYRRLQTWTQDAACFTITCPTDMKGLLLLRNKGHWKGHKIQISPDCMEINEVKKAADANSISYKD